MQLPNPLATVESVWIAATKERAGNWWYRRRWFSGILLESLSARQCPRCTWYDIETIGDGWNNYSWELYIHSTKEPHRLSGCDLTNVYTVPRKQRYRAISLGFVSLDFLWIFTVWRLGDLLDILHCEVWKVSILNTATTHCWSAHVFLLPNKFHRFTKIKCVFFSFQLQRRHYILVCTHWTTRNDIWITPARANCILMQPCAFLLGSVSSKYNTHTPQSRTRELCPCAAQ